MPLTLSAARQQISPNGPEFSRIALGLWRINAWSMTPAQRLEFIQQAVELGVTSIDHADIYGSEAPFGEALALAPSLRDQIEIVTKCGIVPRSDTTALRVSHYDTSRAHIIASLENSLRHMGTDYVDLMLIHRSDVLMQADEVAEAFYTLHKEGKVRHFGVSNFTPAQFELLASRCQLVTNQIELSPLFIDPLHDGTLDQCQRLSISPMIWSALGGGRIFTEQSPRAQRLRITLEALGAEYGVSAGTIVYAWLLQHPSKPVVLTGSGRIAAVKEAVAALDITLSREHWYAVWTASTGTSVP